MSTLSTGPDDVPAQPDLAATTLTTGVEGTAMDQQQWARPSDLHRATAARIYDYFLGGYHNFPADRQAADAIIAVGPHTCQAARDNRAFLGRVVTYLAEDAGIRQFLDIGSGIPTVGNVHEIAQKAAPQARVVYVDIDPVAVYHSRALLAGNETAIAIQGDLLHPQQLLEQARDLLDFDQPVALLLVAVLHFCGEEAYQSVAQLRDALAPGSYLVLSHAMPDALNQAPVTRSGLQVYKTSTSTPVHLRTREQIMPFFGDLQIQPPGVVPVHEWGHHGESGQRVVWVIGGLARKTQ
jgi:SAM-dependent methyltransferase